MVAETYILVMGVSGVGKTTVARSLAGSLDAEFIEADDFHSAENIAAMSAGTPLNDAMRWSWLEAIAAAARDRHGRSGQRVVIACSALKRRYRDLLRERLGPIRIIYLSGTADVIRARMTARSGHFMAPALLESQFADLELPDDRENAFHIDTGAEQDVIVEQALRHLAHAPGGQPARRAGGGW